MVLVPFVIDMKTDVSSNTVNHIVRDVKYKKTREVEVFLTPITLALRQRKRVYHICCIMIYPLCYFYSV